MKLTRSLGIATVSVFLAAAILTFVPSAAAQVEQDVTLSIAQGATLKGSLGPDGRLSPDTETMTFTFKLKIEIPPGTACVGKSYTITYTQIDPGGAQHALVSWTPTAETKVYEGKASNTPAGSFGSTEKNPMEFSEVTVAVTLKQTAPAFQNQIIKIKGTLTGPTNAQSGCTAKPAGGEQTITQEVKADFLPIVQFVPQEIIQKAGQNAKVIFPIEIQNLSNGDAKVDSDIKGGQGLAAVQPPPDGLIIESKAMRGEKAAFKTNTQITVLTPTKNGYTNKVYPFEALFKYTSATPANNLPAPGEVSVPLSVKVQGVYVPGFDGTSMVAALGLAVAGLGLARRRL